MNQDQQLDYAKHMYSTGESKETIIKKLISRRTINTDKHSIPYIAAKAEAERLYSQIERKESKQ